MFRTLLHAAAALGLVATAASAQAGTLSYTGYSVLNDQTVTISDPTAKINEQGGAGQISLLAINGTANSLATWCIDIGDWLQNNGTFTTGGFLTGTFGNQVNALLTHVLPTLNSNTLASAALQIAIWQEEYGSALTVTTNNGSLDSLVSTYVGNVNSGAWVADPTKSVATLRAGGTNQDQAYLVPEPGTLGVMAAAFFGVLALGGWRRLSAGSGSLT